MIIFTRAPKTSTTNWLWIQILKWKIKCPSLSFVFVHIFYYIFVTPKWHHSPKYSLLWMAFVSEAIFFSLRCVRVFFCLFVFCGSIFQVHFDISDFDVMPESDFVSHVTNKQRIDDKKASFAILLCVDRRNTHLVCFVEMASQAKMWFKEKRREKKTQNFIEIKRNLLRKRSKSKKKTYILSPLWIWYIFLLPL